MGPEETRVLTAFKAAVRGRLPIDRVLLFGSRARGDADAFSDMDVMVVVDGEVDETVRDLVSDSAWAAGFEEGIVVVPIVLSKSEWETDQFRSSLLGRAVTEKGLAV